MGNSNSHRETQQALRDDELDEYAELTPFTKD